MMTPDQQQPGAPKAPTAAPVPAMTPTAPAYTPFSGDANVSAARPGMTPTAANGASSPTQTPTGPQATTMPPTVTPFTGTANSASPSPTPQPVSYGQTSSFGPGHDLMSTQIAPGQESNRFDLANQQLQTYKNATLPQYQHDLRSTIQNNAAMGRLGSGQLNTDVGNLDLAQQNNYNTMESSLLNNALGNQITDNANQRNELRSERDYQTGQENTAYNRGVQGLTLQDQLTNSAFGRGLAQEQAGYGSNPADMQAWLSSVYGQQAAGANQALGGMIGSTTQNNILRQIYGGGGGAPQGGSLTGGNTPQPPGQGIDLGSLFGTPTVPQNVPNYGIPDIIG